MNMMLPLIDEPQLTNTQLAGALPRNPRFREWVGRRLEVDDVTEEDAADFIRVMSGVASRREIETRPEAQRSFHNLIRRPFVAYCEELKELA